MHHSLNLYQRAPLRCSLSSMFVLPALMDSVSTKGFGLIRCAKMLHPVEPKLTDAHNQQGKRQCCSRGHSRRANSPLWHLFGNRYSTITSRGRNLQIEVLQTDGQMGEQHASTQGVRGFRSEQANLGNEHAPRVCC